jgi:hypothetical protein
MKRNKSLPVGVTKQPNIGVVNLSTYTSPEIIEVKNKSWVEYGQDNNYFQFLIDRYNGSPTNNAAVNGISQAIYGKGLNATDANKKPDQYAQMISMFGKDCVRKLSYDLKLMGQCAAQIIYSKDRKKIVKVEHFPIETLRAEKANEEGDVPAYYYFKDWTNIKPSDTPLRIPAFGMSKENIEILYIKPYRAGFYYYSPVDYQGGLQYCEIEEEISNFHYNNIRNSFSPNMLINMNNGIPNQEERQLLETKIASKFSGTSNAGKFILSFNNDKESAADVTPIQLSDAHNVYSFLSTEATQKIMVAHRIVSPMLLGIKDNSGLGNNAEEIKTASLLMDNTVIRPFQELLIDSFDQILAYNDISLNLYFTTLQPLEFTEVDTDLQNKEEIEEETGIEMSSQIDGKTAYDTIEEAEAEAKKIGCEGYHEHEVDGVTYYMPCESHDEALDEFLSLGEDEDELLDKYDLIDVSEVDYDNDDDLDQQVTELNEPSLLKKITNLVSTGRAYPWAKDSEQDGGTKQDEDLTFLVRYQYAPLKVQGDSRKFCDKMVATKKIYRKEDIIALTNKPVNAGFGVKGAATYSIWLYKGGARCHHKWFRKTYMLTEGIKKRTEVTTKEARSKGFRAPVNEQLVPVAPNDMQYKGFTKAYWDKMGGFKKKKKK